MTADSLAARTFRHKNWKSTIQALSQTRAGQHATCAQIRSMARVRLRQWTSAIQRTRKNVPLFNDSVPAAA